MTNLARLERDALCDTLLATGPDAPTLCSPWTTADLAAHLVVRERRPDLAAGVLVPALSSRLEEGQAGYAAKPWTELVDLVRSGPPVWSPARLAPVDDAVNLVEFVIHHEDVLRGDGVSGPRRTISLRESDAVWSSLDRLGRLLFRRSPVGVVLRDLDGRSLHARSTTEIGTVVLQGAPVELLLAAYGRRRVAEVGVTGGDEAVEALWGAKLGLG